MAGFPLWHINTLHIWIPPHHVCKIRIAKASRMTWGDFFISMQRNVPAHIQCFLRWTRRKIFCPVQLLMALYSYVHTSNLPSPNINSIHSSSDISTLRVLRLLSKSAIWSLNPTGTLAQAQKFKNKTKTYVDTTQVSVIELQHVELIFLVVFQMIINSKNRYSTTLSLLGYIIPLEILSLPDTVKHKHAVISNGKQTSCL